MAHHVEAVLLPLQRRQQTHDEVAHRDILNLDLFTRLKHHVLHFFKYAGKIEEARESRDAEAVREALIDAFIICLASANALNLSLGEHISLESEPKDLDSLALSLASGIKTSDAYSQVIRQIVLIGGKMAKALESLDHLEHGDWRGTLEVLLPTMAASILSFLGGTRQGLEGDIRKRLLGIEQMSIFRRGGDIGCR